MPKVNECRFVRHPFVFNTGVESKQNIFMDSFETILRILLRFIVPERGFGHPIDGLEDSWDLLCQISS